MEGEKMTRRFIVIAHDREPTGTSIVLRMPSGAIRAVGFDVSGDSLYIADDAHDIGKTGATRPRSIFVGTSINIEADEGLVMTNQTDGAGVGAGTLTDAPSAGDPTLWVPIDINGTVRHFPVW